MEFPEDCPHDEVEIRDVETGKTVVLRRPAAPATDTATEPAAAEPTTKGWSK